MGLGGGWGVWRARKDAAGKVNLDGCSLEPGAISAARTNKMRISVSSVSAAAAAAALSPVQLTDATQMFMVEIRLLFSFLFSLPACLQKLE